jgi:glycosyltransferase involved in cell wall biosynthesis
MKVIQVISSNIPIEQTGNRRWGALELIQSEYQKGLIKKGVECEIKWLNEVKVDANTIVHIHVANLCIEAKKLGIPYIYSNHDHTSFYHGKGSWLYNQQLEAIKGSIFSIAHAESVIDFFPDTDKLFYLPHGVDTLFYSPSEEVISEKKILMVANNGAAGDYGIDRKGFKLGINAAKKLDLPITIVGAEANAKFFEIYPELLNYNKLTVDSSNPTEDIKLGYLKTHSLFLHPSESEFGSPNLTLLESWACGLPMVAAYDGRRHIEGLQKLDSLNVDEICRKIESTFDRYDTIIETMKKDIKLKNPHSWDKIVDILINMYQSAMAIPLENNSLEVKEQYLKLYQ